MRWEDTLTVPAPVTGNRRATTDGLPIRDNRAFRVRVLEDGIGVCSESFYYRRHLNGGIIFSGRYQDGIVLHLRNA